MKGETDRDIIGNIRTHCKDRDILGWFVVKTNGLLQPSVREAAVHRNLNSGGDLLGQPGPLIFLSIVASLNPEDCTQSMDIQCFLQEEHSLGLRPICLQMSSLTHDSISEYSSFRAGSKYAGLW